MAVTFGAEVKEYIIKKISKKLDLASYDSSILAFKQLVAYSKKFPHVDINDYQVVERTTENGITTDEIVQVLE